MMYIKGRNYQLSYQEGESHFDCHFFDQPMLGSRICARVHHARSTMSNFTQSQSSDVLGDYVAWSFDFSPSGLLLDDTDWQKTKSGMKAPYQGIVKGYKDFLIFEIHYGKALANDPRKDLYSHPYVAFPSFEGENWQDDLACLTYKRHTPFNYPIMWRGTSVDSVREGKNVPLMVTTSNFETLILSPFNHLLHGSVSLSKQPNRILCGLPLGLITIPENTKYKTLLVVKKGVNKAFETYGHLLSTHYRMEPISPYHDQLLAKLSYWTNAGSSYWYNTHADHSYETTFNELKKHHNSIGLPIGSYQLDSWWYQKDGHHYTSSITKWKPALKATGANYNSMSPFRKKFKEYTLFRKPRLAHLQAQVKTPIGCHFKQISAKSSYVLNHPKDFAVESYAVPLKKDFFIQLFNHPKWHLSFIVHDWLHYMQTHHSLFLDLKLGPKYFRNLDRALLEIKNEDNLCGHPTMQLCMTPPSTTLLSAKLQSVTTIRSTADAYSFFVEGPKRWWWHAYSAPFIHAMGKYTFYDNRRTNHRTLFGSRSQSNFEMIMLGLYAGPIGLSDAIGKENMPLIKKAIMIDGTILKPDSPAALLDQCYLYNPLTDPDHTTIGWYASNHIPAGGFDILRISYLLYATLAGRVKKAFLIIENLDFLGSAHHYALLDYRTKALQVFDKKEALHLESKKFYGYGIISPIEQGFGFFGLLAKHITASNKIMEKVHISDHHISIYFQVSLSEIKGYWAFYTYKKPASITLAGLKVPYEWREDGLLTVDLTTIDPPTYLTVKAYKLMILMG